LPDGFSVLITEPCPAAMRLVRGWGASIHRPDSGCPGAAQGQGGLWIVAKWIPISRQRFIYLSLARSGERGATAPGARARFNGPVSE